MQELWFLHYAHCLLLIDIYMKICEDSLNSFYRGHDFVTESKGNNSKSILIVLGFNDTSTLEGHFVSSPREREKRDRRDSRGDEKEGQRRKRNRNESEETEEIKTFPLYPYRLQE